MGESQWQNPNGIFCRVPRPLPPTEGVEERRTHLGAEAPKAVPGPRIGSAGGDPNGLSAFTSTVLVISWDLMGI